MTNVPRALTCRLSVPSAGMPKRKAAVAAAVAIHQYPTGDEETGPTDGGGGGGGGGDNDVKAPYWQIAPDDKRRPHPPKIYFSGMRVEMLTEAAIRASANKPKKPSPHKRTANGELESGAILTGPVTVVLVRKQSCHIAFRDIVPNQKHILDVIRDSPLILDLWDLVLCEDRSLGDEWLFVWALPAFHARPDGTLAPMLVRLVEEHRSDILPNRWFSDRSFSKAWTTYDTWTVMQAVWGNTFLDREYAKDVRAAERKERIEYGRGEFIRAVHQGNMQSITVAGVTKHQDFPVLPVRSFQMTYGNKERYKLFWCDLFAERWRSRHERYDDIDDPINDPDSARARLPPMAGEDGVFGRIVCVVDMKLGRTDPLTEYWPGDDPELELDASAADLLDAVAKVPEDSLSPRPAKRFRRPVARTKKKPGNGVTFDESKNVKVPILKRGKAAVAAAAAAAAVADEEEEDYKLLPPVEAPSAPEPISEQDLLAVLNAFRKAQSQKLNGSGGGGGGGGGSDPNMTPTHRRPKSNVSMDHVQLALGALCAHAIDRIQYSPTRADWSKLAGLTEMGILLQYQAHKLGLSHPIKLSGEDVEKTLSLLQSVELQQSNRIWAGGVSPATVTAPRMPEFMDFWGALWLARHRVLPTPPTKQKDIESRINALSACVDEKGFVDLIKAAHLKNVIRKVPPPPPPSPISVVGLSASHARPISHMEQIMLDDANEETERVLELGQQAMNEEKARSERRKAELDARERAQKEEQDAEKEREKDALLAGLMDSDSMMITPIDRASAETATATTEKESAEARLARLSALLEVDDDDDDEEGEVDDNNEKSK